MNESNCSPGWLGFLPVRYVQGAAYLTRRFISPSALGFLPVRNVQGDAYLARHFIFPSALSFLPVRYVQGAAYYAWRFISQAEALVEIFIDIKIYTFVLSYLHCKSSSQCLGTTKLINYIQNSQSQLNFSSNSNVAIATCG